MGATQGSVRWSIERRLEFIEFRLFWEGRVNRSDLMDAFGISVNQAPADSNCNLDILPGKIGLHPSLARSEVIELDFGVRGGKIRTIVRKDLALPRVAASQAKRADYR